MIDIATRALVVQRAANRCEYCRVPQVGYEGRFNIDHVIARQHGGNDELSNLAWCCPKCNRKKGPNVAAIDPQSAGLLQLFHPRMQKWDEHFRWSGATILGITAAGRATVSLLDLNEVERVKLRQSLLSEGLL